MSNHANSQNFDSDRFGEGLRQKDLLSYLEEKYQDKPYHEENSWWHIASVLASYIFQIINVASGFAKPFAYLSGIFSFGAIGGFFAAAIAAFFVLGIEWAARKNLIQLFEKKYFKKRVNGGRVVAQIILNGAIIALSYWGASDAVKIMSGDFVASQPALENEEAIKTHYGLLIASAQKDADAFFAASNWRGKLSPANQRRYNEKLQAKTKWTEEMNQKLSESAERNRMAISESKASDQLALMEKQDSDTKNGNVLALIAVASCLLFTVCIWLKEYYEYRTAMELVSTGTLKNPRFAKMLHEAEKAISDDEIRRDFARSNGVHNSAAPPYPNRPIGFNLDENGNVQAVLTSQPLFDNGEKTVSQSSQTVTQTNGDASATYADDVLKLALTRLQGHAANFDRKHGKNETTAQNIHAILDETLHKMKGSFHPSLDVHARFGAYILGTLFPLLREKGYPYPQTIQFQGWLRTIAPMQVT